MSGTETSHILLHLLHPRTGSVFRPEIGTMHANPVTESYRFAQRDSQHTVYWSLLGHFKRENLTTVLGVLQCWPPETFFARPRHVATGANKNSDARRGGSSAIFAPFQNHIWHDNKNSIKMSFHTYISYLKFLRSKNLKFFICNDDILHCISIFVEGKQ